MNLGIVTISYNQAEYLQEAIDSVRLSAPHTLSYTIVDPGSKDGSLDLIARNRARFSAIKIEPDEGPADGLNKGFAACKADVCGYLNADDRFVPGALDFVADYFSRHQDVNLLLGAIRIVDRNGNPRLRGRAPDRLDPRKFVIGACFAWQQATFFRRELFDRTTGFNAANRITWDGELVLDLALAGAKIGYTNTVLGDFRIYGESITGSGRLVELGRSEAARLQQKVIRAGYRPLSAQQATLERIKYRYNPWRHLKCAFGISLPRLR